MSRSLWYIQVDDWKAIIWTTCMVLYPLLDFLVLEVTDPFDSSPIDGDNTLHFSDQKMATMNRKVTSIQLLVNSPVSEIYDLVCQYLGFGYLVMKI